MAMQEGVEMNVPPQMVGASSHEGHEGRDGLRMRGRNTVDQEEDEYDGVQQDFPSQEERKWGKCTAVVSGLDVVASGVIFITSFSYAYRDAGVSLWCMGIQAISHLLSSLMLTLRFCGEASLPSADESSGQGLLRQERRRFLVREQIVSITMGIVMLLSSAALLFKAFRKIKFWKVWYKDHENMDDKAQFVMEFLAWYGFSVYVLQAIFRLVVARKLKRQIVWHGFVASVISLVFLFIIGVAAKNQKEWSWKAEPMCAIALAFVTLAEGIRIVIMHLDDMDTRLRFDPRA